MTIPELQQQREAALAEMRTLANRAELEQRRDLTPDELRRWNELEGQVRWMSGQIERARFIDTEERVGRAQRYEVPASQRGTVGHGFGGGSQSWFDVRALSAGADAAGGYFVPTHQARQFVDRLVLQAPVLGQVTRVLMESDRLVLPGVSADPTATWVAEGSQLTPSDPTYRAITLHAWKVAGYVLASSELFQDSRPTLADIVQQQLERSVAIALETALFEGTGVNQPTGLKSTAGIETITTLGADGAVPTNFDAIADAVGELIANGARAEALVCYMHPRSWKTLSKMKTGVASSQQTLMQLEQGGTAAAPVRTIYGVPVYFSGAISTTETQGNNSDCSSIYLFDPSQVVFGTREYVRLEATNAMKFDYDQVAIRCVARADFGVLNAGAVARIVGVRA